MNPLVAISSLAEKITIESIYAMTFVFLAQIESSVN